MRNTDYFRNKEVTVVGLARSGLACANLLHSLGARVRITDNQDNPEIRANCAKLNSTEIKLELGRHSREFIRASDLIVVSPGVSATALPLAWAGQLNIPVISEVEAGWILCPADIIAVTGSNGKTTVTTLIGMALKACAKETFICGNIGNPFSAELEKIKEGNFVCLELSSFQLEKIDKFKPRISVLLNLARNHLDRHADMQEYIGCKKRIFMNQDSGDYAVLNADQPLLQGLEKEIRAKVVFFSQAGGSNPNQAAALTVASILGLDRGLVDEALKNFKGLEHRMEFVGEINKVSFINDSKATTADSTAWALKNINAQVVLIAGGKDKGVDYRMIKDAAKNKVRKVIAIGEAALKIEEALGDLLSFERAESLPEAVRKSFDIAEPGNYILLSPMCSSFDMFSGFEERGRVFKQEVVKLKQEKS